MTKRYVCLLVCTLWLCTHCATTSVIERSAVQVTPDSPEATATPTLDGLSQSLTREDVFANATPNLSALATFRVRTTAIHLRTPQPTAIPTLGILEHGEDPALLRSFAPGDLLVSNAWRGLVDGEIMLVYAGTTAPFLLIEQLPREVRNVGRLVIYREDSYTTPEETGALTIVGECHSRLLLTSAGSESLPPQEMTYDLRAREMSDSHPADCVPIATGTKAPSDE